jgi:hypothetical protein
MTLGKIERFWKTVYEEFLVRAQFGSFEEAQERIRHWVKYYNHKRPHQGIGGLYPADRYFEIQGELRMVMEKGIAENVLEMALRGKPKEPFYMVGRMEGQSVVLRAEKGKLRLMVDDEEGGKIEVEKGEKPKVEKSGMEEKKGRRGLGHTPEEKCRAVLSVWTERRKPGEVCRELGVDWGILKQWQDRAMEGMLMALQPWVQVERGVP